MSMMAPSLPQSEQTGFLKTAGQRVRYRVRGDGAPLLMLHGIGAPLELWRPLEPKLADFQTITVDPPGSGRSSTPEGSFGMREYAGVMDALLTHLRLDSAHVLGLSLGGMIAQELAYRSPGRVERLVLASTSCGWTLNPLTRAALPNPGRLRRTPRGDQDASLLRLQAALLREYRPSGRGYLKQLRAGWTWTSRPWLRRLEMPVLVIAGSDDSIVPPVNSRIIASAVQDGRLEIIPGGKHLCLFKESGRCSRLIREFLREG